MQILAILLLIGGLWLILSYLQEVLRSRRYRSFPTAEGVITKLELQERKGRVKTWTPEVAYQFKAGEELIEGTRLTFSRVVVEEKTAAKIREAFAVGNPVRVYFNPRKPLDCVLNPHGADLKNRLILGVVLALAGLGIYLFVLTTRLS